MAVEDHVGVQMDRQPTHQCIGGISHPHGIQKAGAVPDMLGKRFFNVVDSMLMFYAMAKGRSPSKKLNRILRRIMAVTICSRTIPVTLWTLSKWNFADAPSRLFEGASDK